MTTACGDPIRDYFDDVGAVIETMRTDSIAATPRGGEITRDGVIGVNEARRSAAAALAALTPPDEVLPEHLAVVTALDQLVAAVDAFLGDTAGQDEASFATAVGEASDLQSLARSVGLACQSLSDRAAALEVDADIRC